MQKENGFIDSALLHNGKKIRGDFFIDCSGQNALLLGKSLNVEFEDWSHYLHCDRAVAVRTTSTGATPPYTLATARKFGWTWRIPLQQQVGHGYVFGSRFCSDANAKTTLLNIIDGNPVEDIKVIPFTTGRRHETWKHNCLALGMAAGFVEPLESTTLHLIARGMDLFLRYFPDQDCDSSLIREYNQRLRSDYEEVRDFIVLHYCASQRRDTAFWRWCGDIALPDSLRTRIELFKGHGALKEGVDELFRRTSWQSVFEGMGITPAKHCPRVNNIDLQDIRQTLDTIKAAIHGMVRNLPTHEQFLAQKQGLRITS
jgi:tryptophan halogenase